LRYPTHFIISMLIIFSLKKLDTSDNTPPPA
jgi:hypothetical protein